MTKKFKKTLALLLSIVMLMSVIPMGYSFASDVVISGDYAYMLSEAGATITKYNGTDTVVEIPAAIDGNTVVRIGADEASRLMPFYKNASITSVTIPDSVECIGYGAFYQCTSLETVVLGKGVKVIEGGAFRGCSKLTSIDLWYVTTLVYNVFRECPKLTTVTISKNMTSIGADAFTGCSALTTINYEGTEEQWNAIEGLPTFGENVTINYNYAYDCAVYGHIMGEYVAAATATCTENGVIAHWPCIKCEKNFENADATGELETVVITATGHTEEVISAVDATCTQIGYTEGKKCTTCGITTVAPQPVNKLEHNLISEYTIYQTCEEEGYSGFDWCTSCETFYGQYTVLAARGHNFVKVDSLSKDSKCNEKGELFEKCSICEKTRTTELDYADHNYGEWKTDKEASCTEKGIKLRTCKVCLEPFSEEIPSLGHAWEDANCTDAKTCSVCGETEGEALGHTWENATCTVAKTCSACGETEGEPIAHTWTDATCTAAKTCSVCGATEGEPIAHAWDDATCTAAKTCSVCGETEGEALGHAEVSHEAKAPTCTAFGWDAYVTCSRCDYTTYEKIDATGHTEKVIPGTPATCIKAGLTDGVVCEVCDEVLEQRRIIGVLGHDYQIDETVSKTYCTEKGIEKADCSRCDATYTVEVEPTGHIITNWVVSEEATCTSKGLLIGKCNQCPLIEQKETDKLDHIDADANNQCDCCDTKLGNNSGSDDDSNNNNNNNPEDDKQEEGCTCYCHKTGFLRFLFFDIPQLFLRILGLNRVCACGEAHY